MQRREKLSSTQQQVLKFFNESAANDGVPSTVRDVMTSFKPSPRGAHLQLPKLADLPRWHLHG